MNSTIPTDKVKKLQKPYSFSCSCGHSQRGIAYPSEIRRIWHEYYHRHRREVCEPRIEAQTPSRVGFCVESGGGFGNLVWCTYAKTLKTAKAKCEERIRQIMERHQGGAGGITSRHKTKRRTEMKIGEMKLKEVAELRSEMAKLFGETSPAMSKQASQSHSFEIGKNYFIRTVTYHFTGKLTSVTDTDLVLVDAAWIADDGRFAQAIAEGKLNEVEPYPDGQPVIVSRAALIDATEFKAALPRVQK